MEERRIIIDGIETDYYATEEGEIISYKNGIGINNGQRKILKPILSGNKKQKDNLYHSVNLLFNNNDKIFRVHRLVYQTFKGIIPDGMVINHLDSNKLNNKLSNLECVTQKQNCIDHHKRQKCGIKFKLEIYRYDVYQNTVDSFREADKFIGSKGAAGNIIYIGSINKKGWDVKQIFY